MNTRTASLGLFIILATAAMAQTPESAADRAAKRVQRLVEPAGTAALTSGPAALPGAKPVEHPEPPLTRYAGLPPQPPVAQAKPPRPRSAAEGQPPIGQGAAAPRTPMPTKPVIQLPAVDVEKPLPIPVLGQPTQDRAALDDVTLEASRSAALVNLRPRRTERVPFAPVNLPDPFENQRTGALRNPLAESDQPPAVPVRTPK